MKRLVVLALVAACGSASQNAAKVDLAPLRHQAALAPCPSSIGQVPDLTLTCLGGGPAITIKGTGTGRPTLVNVYGSWCGPCQQEMPVLAAFAAKAGGTVDLLGVDTEDEPRLALLFAFDTGQRWPAVEDPQGRFLRAYGSGPPITLFVDPAGRVVFVKRGAFASVAELTTAVRTHLSVVLP